MATGAGQSDSRSPWRRVLFPGARDTFRVCALAAVVWLVVWMVARSVVGPRVGSSGAVYFDISRQSGELGVGVSARQGWSETGHSRPNVNYDRYDWGLTMPWWTTISYLVHVPGGSLTASERDSVARAMSRTTLARVAGLVPVPVVPGLIWQRRGWGRPDSGQQVAARMSILGVAGDLSLVYAVLCGARAIRAVVTACAVRLTRRRVPPDIALIRRGLCPGCRYSVDLRLQKVCPECGLDLTCYRGEVGEGVGGGGPEG